MRERPIIVIDGPAGAGKSTVGKALAKRLSLAYLDTGALYRAVAYAARQMGVAPEDEEGLARLCEAAKLSLADENGELRIFINGRDVTEHLRSEEIGLLASKVSAIPAVRRSLLPLQRRAGDEGGIVAEGRDMGTVVFPDAEHKFFLGASVEERAGRRQRELADKGIHLDLGDVKNDIGLRDRLDSERATSPLIAAEDAFVIDSTSMTVAEVVDEIISIIDGS